MHFGIDEVGRGCWAGPLVVAAVSLKTPIEGLADSKELSEKVRAHLEKQIYDTNIVIIESLSAREVDGLGLGAAMYEACERLFSSISKHDVATITIDGGVNYLPNVAYAKPVVKADATVEDCMAASIAAKQFRDRYMQKVDIAHPEYGFASHVGYGTAKHKQAISEHGIIDEHRKSFKPIKQYLEGNW